MRVMRSHRNRDAFHREGEQGRVAHDVSRDDTEFLHAVEYN